MPATIKKLSETLQLYEPISEERKMFKQTLSLHLDNAPDSPDEECVENILMDLDTEFFSTSKPLKDRRHCTVSSTNSLRSKK